MKSISGWVKLDKSFNLECIKQSESEKFMTSIVSFCLSLSSKNILPFPSFTNLAPHGSGTYAPSISFFKIVLIYLDLLRFLHFLLFCTHYLVCIFLRICLGYFQVEEKQISFPPDLWEIESLSHFSRQKLLPH